MKCILKMELRRAFQSKLFYISLIVGVVICVINSWLSIDIFKNNGDFSYPWSFMAGWLPMNFQLPYGRVFLTLLPLYVTFAYGGSYYDDLHSGYIKNILIKCSKKDYYRAKYVVCFFMGFLLCFFTLFVSFFLTTMHMPIVKPNPFVELAGITNNHFMSELYFFNPIFYCLFYSLIDSYFAGLFAVTALCISEYMNNKFEVIVAPFVLVVVSGCIFRSLYITQFSVLDIIDPGQTYLVNGICLGLVMIIWTLITIIKFCIINVKKEMI